MLNGNKETHVPNKFKQYLIEQFFRPLKRPVV
jgi:hypothetical protein